MSRRNMSPSPPRASILPHFTEPIQVCMKRCHGFSTIIVVRFRAPYMIYFIT